MEEGLAIDRLGAGGADDMLRQHVEAGRPRRIAVELARLDRLQCRQRLQHLETVGRRDHGAARLVEPVVGAADALHQAAHALGRAHLDHEIDVAPVDAEVERRGRHHGAQPARRHRRLDLAALLDGKRAVMQADRQVLVVEAPQTVEGEFGLRTRIDEHDRGLVLADDIVDFRHGMLGHVAAPRQAILRIDDRDVGRCAGFAMDDFDCLAVAQTQIIRELRRIGDRRRKADEARLRRQRRQPREAQRQMMAALGGRERVQLVDDDAAQACKESRGVGIAQEQRQRLGCRQQDVRRPFALADTPALRRIAGPALGAHRQLHLGDRHFEVAADVRRQRLERRDVERVQLALALGVRQVLAGLPALGELDQRRQKARQRLAAAGWRDQQRTLALGRKIDQGQLVPARRPAATFEPA